MYKVFINDKVIYFTNNKEIINSEFNFIKINFFDVGIIDTCSQLLKKNKKLQKIFIFVEDVEASFILFKNHFKIIKAAGGWVKNQEDKNLFIYRLDKWDLPKGKIEEGESNHIAAIREVEEECGISGLSITNQLPDTFHIYEMNDEVILKQTYWFKMQSSFDGELIPQTEEDITKVEWLTDEEIKSKVLSNTYASIADLMN